MYCDAKGDINRKHDYVLANNLTFKATFHRLWTGTSPLCNRRKRATEIILRTKQYKDGQYVIRVADEQGKSLCIGFGHIIKPHDRNCMRSNHFDSTNENWIRSLFVERGKSCCESALRWSDEVAWHFQACEEVGECSLQCCAPAKWACCSSTTSKTP